MRTITRLPLSILAIVMGFSTLWFYFHPDQISHYGMPALEWLPFVLGQAQTYIAIDLMSHEVLVTYLASTLLIWLGTVLALSTLYGAALGRPIIGALIEQSKHLTAGFITALIAGPVAVPEDWLPHPMSGIIPLMLFITIFTLSLILTIPKRRAAKQSIKTRKKALKRMKAKQQTGQVPEHPQPKDNSFGASFGAQSDAVSDSGSADTPIVWNSNKKHDEDVLVLMMKVALSGGGKISPSENRVLRQFARKIFIYPGDYERLLQHAKATLSEKEYVHGSLEDLDALCSVAYADGYLHEQEYKMLESIALNMGFTKDTISAAIVAHRTRKPAC